MVLSWLCLCWWSINYLLKFVLNYVALVSIISWTIFACVLVFGIAERFQVLLVRRLHDTISFPGIYWDIMHSWVSWFFSKHWISCCISSLYISPHFSSFGVETYTLIFCFTHSRRICLNLDGFFIFLINWIAWGLSKVNNLFLNHSLLLFINSNGFTSSNCSLLVLSISLFVL